MADVLKAEPGVSDVEIGVTVGPNPIDSGILIFAERGWVHPFIDYTTTDRRGYRERLRFESTRGIRPDWTSLNDVGSDEFSFMTMLNGLSVGGERADDVGTHAVTAKWEAVCGVNASVVYN